MPFHIDFRHFCRADFNPDRIFSLVEPGRDFEAGLSRRGAKVFEHGLVGTKRYPSPIVANVTETCDVQWDSILMRRSDNGKR